MGFFNGKTTTPSPTGPSPKGGVPSKITPLTKPEKPPEKPKDTSAFGGESFFDPKKQGIRWLDKNRNRIYTETKGRITRAKIPEYGKKLLNPKYGFIEKTQREPDKIEREMQKKMRGADSSQERQKIKQDMGIISRMFGSGKK